MVVLSKKGSYAVSILLFLSIGACKNKSQPEQELSSGKKIYEERCSSCHGVDGKKMMAGAPDLTRSKMSMEERIEIIKNGKGAMIPFKDILNDQEIEAVARYLDEFKPSE